MSGHRLPIVAALVMQRSSADGGVDPRGIGVLQERAMSVLAVVLSLALVLAAFVVRGCIWAIRPRQHDDTDTPLLRMLKDD